MAETTEKTIDGTWTAVAGQGDVVASAASWSVEWRIGSSMPGADKPGHPLAAMQSMTLGSGEQLYVRSADGTAIRTLVLTADTVL